MKKITLRLYEIYTLLSEIEGITDPQTNKKIANGMIDEKLAMRTRFWMNDLVKKASDIRDSVEVVKNALIKKYGEANSEGIIMIAHDNPNYVSFINEFNALLQEEKEMEYREFSIEDFANIETNTPYNVFFRFVRDVA